MLYSENVSILRSYKLEYYQMMIYVIGSRAQTSMGWIHKIHDDDDVLVLKLGISCRNVAIYVVVFHQKPLPFGCHCFILDVNVHKIDVASYTFI